MKFLEAIKIALDSLRAHKLRSFLTLLGVIFGVMTVVAVASVIQGFFSYVNKTGNQILGANTVVLTKFGIITSFEDFIKANKTHRDITLEDLEYLRAHSRLAQYLAAQGSATAEVKAGNALLRDISVLGVSASMVNITTVQAEIGRYISPVDEERCRYVTLLGSEVAQQLFNTTEVLGREVKIAGLPFEIIGVAKEQGTIFGQSQDNFVVIPISVYQKMWGSRRSLSVSIKGADETNLEDLQDEIRMLMRIRHHLDYNDEDTFSLVTADALNNFFQSLLGIIAAVALGITSISLVVGGIVIMNIMLVTVTERTHEIGIRKSLGARRKDILMQFLTEATVLSACGGVVGLGIAYLIARLLSAFTPIPTELPVWAAVLAIMVSGGVGLIFGSYPAWKASRLDPVVALRAE
jgi:putative ABC transport system permease protein